MDPTETVRVVCENCGGTDWTALLVGGGIGLLGLLIGIGALIYAARAFGVAEQTLTLTKDALDVARKQHALDQAQFDVAQAERAARAAFRLDAEFYGDGVVDGGKTMVLTTPNANVRVRVGVGNVGTRAAGKTTINVLVPARYREWLRWSGALGQELADVAPPDTTDEIVGVGEQSSTAVYLTRVVDSIARQASIVGYFMFSVDALDADVVRRIPVRLKAQADEIDGFEEVVDVELTIRYDSPHG